MNDEKKAKIQALRQKLANLTDQEKAEIIERGIVLSVQGKAISTKNTLLLYVQSGELATAPSVVGGYRQWQEQGRQVKKGEHALSIWAPSSRKVKEEVNGEEQEHEENYFFLVPVFDISQTEERQAA